RLFVCSLPRPPPRPPLLPYTTLFRSCPACSGKDPHCRRCERAGTLLLPALAADHLRSHTPSIAAEDAFRDGFPLEDAVDRNVSTDRKSTRLNSSHVKISYAVFCLKKK